MNHAARVREVAREPTQIGQFVDAFQHRGFLCQQCAIDAV